MLEVRYGSFAALEEALEGELKALKAGSPWASAAIVCPSRRMAERLERNLARERGMSLLGVRLHTFYSWAREILAESALAPPIVREPIFFERLVDSLLPPDPSRPRGLAAAYRASLKDLIDAGVEPRALELVEEGLLADPEEARRLRSLLLLLKAYEGRLRELGALPPSALISLAREAARGSAALKRYRAVFYYGFYDLTGLQADFLEVVSGERPVTLLFPYRAGHPAFSFVKRFFETKLHAGGRTPKPLPEPRGGALAPLASALFVPARRAPAGGALRLLNASGARDEAWRAAKEILRLVEEEGYAFDEIGVAVRALESYWEPLRDVFSQSRVPFQMDFSEPLLRRPAARACRALLGLARGDFPALDVLDLLESPFLRTPPMPHWPELIRRLRIHRGWLQWEGKLSSEKEGWELLALLASWRQALTPSGRRPWSSWSERARSLLRETLDGLGEADYDEALSALESLARLDPLGEVSWEEFLDAALDSLGRKGLPLVREGNFGVRVLDAMQARGESFRALFILGLQSGLFPRKVREDPILREEAREALRESGGYWIAPKRAGYDEEALLFHLLVCSARERLYASYSRSDEEGRVQAPSLYLLELCRAAGVTLAECEHVPRQPLARLGLEAARAFLTPQEAALWATLSGGSCGPLYEALGLDPKEALERLRRARGLARYGEAGEFDGLIGPPTAYLSALRGRGLSPTALESLSRCPFQFFASRILGLEETEEPVPQGELPRRVQGELYHRLIARFHEARGAGRRASWGPSEEAALRRAEEEVLGVLTWRELGLYPLLWEIERGRMRRALRAFLIEDVRLLEEEGLSPRSIETEVRAVLPVALPAALEGMPFRGVPDRVDVGEGGFRVVEYKSLWRRADLEAGVAKGELFQPPLYLELLLGRPALEGKRPLGVRYASLEGAAFFEYGVEAHARQREGFLRRLRESAERVAGGLFPIRPQEGEHGHCRFCRFSGVCRKNHPASLARARSRP